jgi:hypothetical protein
MRRTDTVQLCGMRQQPPHETMPLAQRACTTEAAAVAVATKDNGRALTLLLRAVLLQPAVGAAL